MRIAICDDERTALETLSALTEDYCLQTRRTAEYTVFDSYEALEESAEQFDVYILDYKMPGEDGLSFARRLREADKSKTIIFVTAYDEIVLDAFVVQTHRFLMKPVDRTKFFEALDSLWENRSRTGQLMVKTGTVTEVLDLSEIYYIQVVRKELYICTEHEQIVCRRSIASLQQELESMGFFRTHRSFLVNLRNVKSFDRNFAQFPNGEKVPIGTRRYPAFCKAYLRVPS